MNDEQVHKAKENAKRQAKKSCKPTDSRVVTGMEGLRQSGKGDKYRNIEGWYSQDMTDKLERIFGKKKTAD